MSVSDFMMNLADNLKKKKGITESSANLYLNRLYTLNNKRPFTNLAFLRKKDEIFKKLEPYADTTFRGFLTSIVSTLSLYNDKPSYHKLYNFYSNILNQKSDEAREYQKKYANHKTAKQQKNWIKWDEILKIKNDMKEDVMGFCSKRHITHSQKELLLQFLVLSLYTDIPPRRNQDYQYLYLVKDATDKPKDKNYLSIDDKTLHFNKYKTAKKYGAVKINITDNEPLRFALRCYLAHHPHNKGKKGKKFMTPLLVHTDGTPLTNPNAITRILNKIFKKKVGSSMLRHIYLTSKYGDELKEMKEDSEAMGHSVSQQRDYIKDKPPVETKDIKGSGEKPDADIEALLTEISGEQRNIRIDDTKNIRE